MVGCQNSLVHINSSNVEDKAFLTIHKYKPRIDREDLDLFHISYSKHQSIVDKEPRPYYDDGIFLQYVIKSTIDRKETEKQIVVNAEYLTVHLDLNGRPVRGARSVDTHKETSTLNK